MIESSLSPHTLAHSSWFPPPPGGEPFEMFGVAVFTTAGCPMGHIKPSSGWAPPGPHHNPFFCINFTSLTFSMCSNPSTHIAYHHNQHSIILPSPPHNHSPLPPLSFPLDHIRHQTKARHEASRSSPLVHRPWMGEKVREISPWPDRVCRYGSSLMHDFDAP